MTKVFDIRGTNGSGKSYFVHQYLEKHKHHEWIDEWGDHRGYTCQNGVMILGMYPTVCGGCDRITNVREIEYLAKQIATEIKPPVMLMEGILVSHTFQRWADVAEEVGNWTFCFLDTPQQVCIDRVQARRDARGEEKPYDPKNCIKDFGQIAGVKRKMEAIGRTVLTLDHTRAAEQMEELICECL